MGALPAILVLLVGLIVLAAWGIASRTRAMTEVTRETHEMAVTTVAVVRPTPGSPTQDLVLPGNVQPFEDAPIFARTNGYVRKWYTDLGARVKAGQLLAELDTPEVDQELSQARADLATAEANLRLAQSTADRYADLLKSDSVARQDYDNAKGSFEARRAAAQSAEFNVKRLEQLSDFKQIRAPFDGAITARNIDVGALVGSGNSARELFHIASTHRLRVFVNVPQPYSPATAPGIAASLTLSEFPDRKFTGTLARTAKSIDPASRTLLVEIDVDNKTGELLPGSYVQAHFTLPERRTTVRVPVTTLLFRAAGAQIALVDHEQKVRLRPVAIERDLGTEMEVAAGLTGDEQIIDNPPDSIAEGQQVRIAEGKKKTE